MASASDIAVFRAKFSELSSVLDADVASSLNTVDVMIDASMWPSKKDFTLARMLLAAHLTILQQQQLSNATIDGTGLSDLFVRQIRFGERAIGFAQRKYPKDSQDTAPGESMLNVTYYGEQYLQLRARNIIGVMVV